MNGDLGRHDIKEKGAISVLDVVTAISLKINAKMLDNPLPVPFRF